MIEFIIAVTILVQSLSVTEDAYGKVLGYEVTDRGTVATDQAALWGTPEMVGAPYILMGPSSGDAFRLRFIQATPTPGYAPLQTHGWNATELLVKDPDALAGQLKGSAFSVIGPPYDLTADGAARAMQVSGPSGEILYLTRISGGYVQTFGTAQSPVDRAFIVVLGGPDHQALIDFYGQKLGQTIVVTGDFRITMLSRALGLPKDTTYPIASARTARDFSIELDGYPPQTRPRPQRAGELPPGQALVTFAVADLDALGLDWRAPPRKLDIAPYHGRRAAVAIGPAGEWLEFIETANP